MGIWMEIIEFLKEKGPGKALVFGMGGGGDIIATVPTASFLKEFGFEVFHGSIVWDRYIIDSKPGPRSLEELTQIDRINETVAIACGKTRISEDVKPTVARAAEHFEKVIALDITKGPERLAEGIKDFMSRYGVSVVIAVDSGGDVLASGFESGVRSPLADAVSLAALSRIRDSLVGVFGFGSDGELRIEEILIQISELLKIGAFVGCIAMGRKDCMMMENITKDVTTEASMIPLRAFKGEMGFTKIRMGRTVPLFPISILTFFFRADGVFEKNRLAKEILKTRNIREAREILNRMGIFTEMDFEYMISRKGIPWDEQE
jgi:hypothetical protein